jgi:hypothetical protein
MPSWPKQPKGAAGGETGGIVSALAFGVRVEEPDHSVVATFDHRYKVIDSWVSLWVRPRGLHDDRSTRPM